MREVRVYDGDFPTFEQMLAGGSASAFPKEIWLQQMKPGEFAVRYKDFKTGLARNPAGQIVKSSEICRIFGCLEEARADSKEVARNHWTVRCFIYDHTGTQVGTISNNKEVSKFALAAYIGVLVWLGLFGIVGMGLLWIVSKIALFVLAPFLSAYKPPSSLGWVGWTAYAIAGVLVGVLAWHLRIQFMAKRRVERLHSNLNSIITPEEKKRFEELNTLHGSNDPAERKRFLKLLSEYQQKLGQALKK